MPAKFLEVPEPFRCDVEPDREAVVVRPVGELDLATVDLVDRQLTDLREAGFQRLVLRLDRLTFIDSTGLRMALTWRRAADADGFSFAIVDPQPAVLRAFELAGLDAYLGFDGSVRS